MVYVEVAMLPLSIGEDFQGRQKTVGDKWTPRVSSRSGEDFRDRCCVGMGDLKWISAGVFRDFCLGIRKVRVFGSRLNVAFLSAIRIR